MKYFPCVNLKCVSHEMFSMCKFEYVSNEMFSLCRFDFLVVMVAAIGLLLELVDANFYYLLVLRPLRLLRSVSFKFLTIISID